MGRRAWLGEDEGETTSPKSSSHDRPHLGLEQSMFMTHVERKKGVGGSYSIKRSKIHRGSEQRERGALVSVSYEQERCFLQNLVGAFEVVFCTTPIQEKLGHGVKCYQKHDALVYKSYKTIFYLQ